MTESSPLESAEFTHSETATIDELLGELASGGKESFCWAWERIGDVFIKDIQLKNKLTPEVQAVFQKNKGVTDLWNELNQRVYDANMDSSVITDEEFERAVNGYKVLLTDLEGALG